MDRPDKAKAIFNYPILYAAGDVDLGGLGQKNLEEYLRQAHRKGFPVVRIIHGKGIGVQREIVRTILSRTPFAQSWTDAPPDAGGLGATVVRLASPRDESMA